MPASNYNSLFGGKRGSASKAEHAMEARYGKKKGRGIFYGKATNEAKRRGLTLADFQAKPR